jgi:hypothetical protein
LRSLEFGVGREDPEDEAELIHISLYDQPNSTCFLRHLSDSPPPPYDLPFRFLKNETCLKIGICQHFPIFFPFQNGVKWTGRKSGMKKHSGQVKTWRQLH